VTKKHWLEVECMKTEQIKVCDRMKRWISTGDPYWWKDLKSYLASSVMCINKNLRWCFFGTMTFDMLTLHTFYHVRFNLQEMRTSSGSLLCQNCCHFLSIVKYQSEFAKVPLRFFFVQIFHDNPRISAGLQSTLCSKKHPLTFSFISLWKMFRFIQNFQGMFMRN